MKIYDIIENVSLKNENLMYNINPVINITFHEILKIHCSNFKTLIENI